MMVMMKVMVMMMMMKMMVMMITVIKMMIRIMMMMAVQVLSRDSVTVTVDAVIYYRVSNPTMVSAIKMFFFLEKS